MINAMQDLQPPQVIPMQNKQHLLTPPLEAPPFNGGANTPYRFDSVAHNGLLSQTNVWSGVTFSDSAAAPPSFEQEYNHALNWNYAPISTGYQIPPVQFAFMAPMTSASTPEAKSPVVKRKKDLQIVYSPRMTRR